jgi:uncharacterized membrane protein required for colicin V production
MLEVAALVILFLCIAFVFNEGLWSACLLLMNLLLAGIIAVNFFEPLANWLDSMFPAFTYFWDFLSIWLCFAIALVVLRLATHYLSRHRVRFKRPVDMAGGMFFAFLVGYVMLQFTLFTMHLAPLKRNFLGFQEQPDTRMVFGLAPDRTWLGFMNKLSDSSAGSLSRSPSAADPTAYVFNPEDDFILKYGQRRKQYEKEPSLTVGK